jgi:ParB-like chromosome segregation protein Spo0J
LTKEGQARRPHLFGSNHRNPTLKPETVQEIAQSILEVGQQAPILVRRDGDRFVLVHGLHRLEACKALGEETIYEYLVQAQKH